jgi:hypothetical protein
LILEDTSFHAVLRLSEVTSQPERSWKVRVRCEVTSCDVYPSGPCTVFVRDPDSCIYLEA